MKEVNKDLHICVIGLGYVGLPLAAALAEKFIVTGFDIKPKRIEELTEGFDSTFELSNNELKAVENKIAYTGRLENIREASVYILTVPTLIDSFKKPDLNPLKNASAMVGEVLKPGDVVISESTVFPGCTEEICVPILEEKSGLTFNKDFFCGYSPERINPGDKEHRIHNILKVTSGSTPEVAEFVDEIYRSIITAGTHRASSLKVAEAAKVIENAQRDLNIAFVNELAMIFEKLGLNTTEVLEAAGTKWNFLPFKPGLVGGHCIGVDPYYLTYKAESIGYHPQVILAGRRINDEMGIFIANKMMKLLVRKNHPVKGSRVLVMGITFKEDCPDIRNTRVVDVIAELKSFGIEVDVYDPHASKEEVREEYGLELTDYPAGKYNGVLLAVKHKEFADFNWDSIITAQSVFYDVKSFIKEPFVDAYL